MRSGSPPVVLPGRIEEEHDQLSSGGSRGASAWFDTLLAGTSASTTVTALSVTPSGLSWTPVPAGDGSSSPGESSSPHPAAKTAMSVAIPNRIRPERTNWSYPLDRIVNL